MTKEYIRRINLGIEFINKNLDQELNLAIVSKVALYSPFHFHRLFTAVTGEQLNKYIQRLRIERAAFQIKKDKKISISEIASSNGFLSNSSFSKAFKNHYGISPTFLKNNTSEFSKIRQINSKNGQLRIEISNDLCDVNHLKHIVSIATIDIKNIPTIPVAYVNHVGAFDAIGEAYSTLMKWAFQNNLKEIKPLTRFHDSPEVTELNQIRQSACVAIPHSFEPTNDISFSTIESGKHAVGTFELEMKDLDNAWQVMMLWMAEKGLVPDEQKTCFEIYHNHFPKKENEKFVIEIFIPYKS